MRRWHYRLTEKDDVIEEVKCSTVGKNMGSPYVESRLSSTAVILEASTYFLSFLSTLYFEIVNNIF